MRLAWIVLLITAGAAHAEAPSKITFTGGLGLAVNHFETEIDDVGFTAGWSLRLDTLYRVRPDMAVGIHGGTSFAHAQDYATGQGYDYEFDYREIELGVTAQLTFDRFWVAPWIGVSKLIGALDLESQANASLGYGVAAGYGIYALPDGHYIDVFVSATRSAKNNPYYDPGFSPETVAFTTLSLGIAYRY